MKEALKQVSLLVERFERNIEAYRSPAYNETQLRREFIDPFFEALGWDVANKAGYAEQYKDVVHEDAIKVAGVTKLSLLLKVLEGENQDSLERQIKLFKERALPDLGTNIKCGNSLIGPDFYQGKQMSLLDSEEAYRINAFDWEKEFPEIIKHGGFDAVIGNPPYVRSITLKETNPLLWEFCRSRYRAASAREWDIYLVFVEKGLSLLKGDGSI
jgi:hypothetical protein